MARTQVGALGRRLAFVSAFAVLGPFVAGTAVAAEDGAELNPQSISIDEVAELRIPVEASSKTTPPKVDGLDIEPAGQSSEMTSVNGVVTQHAWRLYRVTPRGEGTYRIPVGDETLALTVVRGGLGSGRTNGAAAAGAASPATHGTNAPNGGPLAFLRVRIARKRAYVGQAVPMVLRAYFRAGTQVTLTAPPSLNNPAFTVTDLSDKPRQSTEVVDGREYGVASWTALVSAAMPGKFAPDVTVPIVARYQDPARASDSPFGDFFADDPTASSMFKSMLGSGFSGFTTTFADPFGPVREKELTLRSPAETVEVLPLPAMGKPADFSGAVGHFNLQSSVVPVKGTAFEPLTLTVSVMGQGNFDRVTPPSLTSSSDWKSYSGTARFIPKTPGSVVSGTKSLAQPVVPEHAGALVLPALSFSFFDPDGETYVTRTTDPIRVSVTAAPAGPSAIAAAPQPVNGEAKSRAPSGDNGAMLDLRANHATSGPVGALAPQRNPVFLSLLTLPWLALMLGFAFALSRRALSSKLRHRDQRAQFSAERREMHRAADAADTVRFFRLARSVITNELAQTWSISNDQITPTEIEGRLGTTGLPLAAALLTAEQLQYAGGSIPTDGLGVYDRTVSNTLDQVEAAS